MKGSLVVLFAAIALVGVTGTVAADAGPPEWPDEETTTGNNSTGVAPGQQLAGAVGAQGASVEGELWNRTLSDKLDNATTPGERADVVANETETLEAHVEALESVRENLTEAWADGEMSEGEYRASLSAFVVRARMVELRANRTATAAENFAPRMRANHDVNVTRIRDVADRAHELYQFEDDIGREVANETLADENEKRPLLDGNHSREDDGQ